MIKTKLYTQQWPDIVTLLDQESKPRPIKPDFLEAVKKVLPFSPDGLIYSGDGEVSSHHKWSEHQGASLTMPVMDGPKRRIYIGKNLMLLPEITHIDEGTPDNDMTLFWGTNLRGAISHRNYMKYERKPGCKGFMNECECEDCIPF